MGGRTGDLGVGLGRLLNRFFFCCCLFWSKVFICGFYFENKLVKWFVLVRFDLSDWFV